METQDILNLETGTKESIALSPKDVKIVSISVEEVGENKNKKLVCTVKHPDKEEFIKISAVKLEMKGKLESIGLWVNVDDEKKLRKGSALANFLSHLDCKTPNDLEAKETPTTLDSKGYLCFKAY